MAERNFILQLKRLGKITKMCRDNKRYKFELFDICIGNIWRVVMLAKSALQTLGGIIIISFYCVNTPYLTDCCYMPVRAGPPSARKRCLGNPPVGLVPSSPLTRGILLPLLTRWP